jgi:Mrp family chromosome partitioning ATPase/capsular polysaccharide biosynthesis protein
VTERPADATSHDSWQADPAEPRADRPGIVASLLRYRLIVVAVTLLGALAGYGIAQAQPTRYEAKADLVMSDPGGSSILGGASSSISDTDRQVYLAKQADLMTSSIVLGRALGLLQRQQSLSDLRHDVSVAPAKDLASISIRATGSDAASAAALANAVGTAYEQVTAERATQNAQRAIASMEKIKVRLQNELDAGRKLPDGSLTSRQQQLAGQITDLQQREEDIATQASVYASGVELFEPAVLPTSPTQPKPKLYALLGALLGLLGAGAWAWWRAARNQRAEGRADPARILGAPLLGEVPQLEGIPLSEPPQALTPSAADAYHRVVASLCHELAVVGGSSVVVTSVAPDDHKTSTTLQIASAALDDDRKILLIDADDRSWRLSHLCGVFDEASGERNGHEPAPVSVDAAVDAEEYVHRLVVTPSGTVLPATPNGSGPGHPLKPWRAPQVRHALVSVGKLFDLVLIDAPALLAASDAMSVAEQADGVVLVLNHGVLLSQLRDVRESLAFVNTPLIGYVYVRPTSGGARMLWKRARRRLGQGARRLRGSGDVPKIATGPDPVNVQKGGSESEPLGPPPRVSPRRRRRTTAGSAPSSPTGSGRDS